MKKDKSTCFDRACANDMVPASGDDVAFSADLLRVVAPLAGLRACLALLKTFTAREALSFQPRGNEERLAMHLILIIGKLM